MFAGPQSIGDEVGIRFIEADDAMLAAHRRSREGSPKHRSPYSSHREILFSACRAGQTAKERRGEGDFSRYALSVLWQGISGVKNGDFIDRVRSKGSWDNQRPQLWSDPMWYDQQLLGAPAGVVSTEPGSSTGSSLEEKLDQFQQMLDAMRADVRRFARNSE